MAKCSRCGKSVGLFTTVCDTCKAELEQEAQREKKAKSERKTQALERYNSERERLTLAIAQSLLTRIRQGERIVLYEDVYLPVNSVLMDEIMNNDRFGIGILRNLGTDGWDVVAVIPRTIGIGLTNRSVGSTSGTTWGGGIGGNVGGVYVILKLDATPCNVSDEFVIRYVANHLDDLLGSEQSKALASILSVG